jgi:hypothetical protein
MLYMLRNMEHARERAFATDTRKPLIILSWGKRCDAEMFTQAERDTLPLPKHCEWIPQGEGWNDYDAS